MAIAELAAAAAVIGWEEKFDEHDEDVGDRLGVVVADARHRLDVLGVASAGETVDSVLCSLERNVFDTDEASEAARLASSLADRGDVDGAIRIVDAIRSLEWEGHPKTVVPAVVEALARVGRVDDAIEETHAAPDASSWDRARKVEAFIAISDVLFAAGELEEAAEVMEHAESLLGEVWPERADDRFQQELRAAFVFAQALERRGQHERARALARRSLDGALDAMKAWRSPVRW